MNSSTGRSDIYKHVPSSPDRNIADCLNAMSGPHDATLQILRCKKSCDGKTWGKVTIPAQAVFLPMWTWVGTEVAESLLRKNVNIH